MSVKKIYLGIIFSLLLFGCGKDDFAPDKVDCTYDGKNFSLDKGFIRCNYYDADWKQYEYEVFLTSSSISWSENQESFIGKGNWMAFGFVTEKEGLAEGTYNLDYGLHGIYTTEICFETIGNPDSYGYVCSSGSVDISRDGNNYKFDFSFRTEDNKILKGVFEGPLISLKNEVGNDDDFKLNFTHASLISIDNRDGEVEYGVVLMGDGITYNAQTNTYKGSDNWVKIYFTSSVESLTIPEATYVFSYYGNDYYWNECYWYYSGNPKDSEDDFDYSYSHEPVTVKKNGDIYTITTERFSYCGTIQ